MNAGLRRPKGPILQRARLSFSKQEILHKGASGGSLQSVSQLPHPQASVASRPLKPHRRAFLLLLASPLLGRAAEPKLRGGWTYREVEGTTYFAPAAKSARPRSFAYDPGSLLTHGDGEYFFPGASPTSLAALQAMASLPYASIVRNESARTQLDPALVHAVIHVESRHNARAESPKGAIGLMQVLPETARRMGVDAFRSPEGNVRAGTRYLRFLLDTFDREVELALAAYNAGENAVIHHGGRIPPYRETEQYVPAVLAAYRTLRGRRLR